MDPRPATEESPTHGETMQLLSAHKPHAAFQA